MTKTWIVTGCALAMAACGGKSKPAATTGAGADDELTTRTPGEPEPEPPPPEDSDRSGESGGTGTALALDEGKMGPRQPDPHGVCAAFWPQTLAGVAPGAARADVEKALGKPSKSSCTKASAADAEEGVRFTRCEVAWSKRGLTITFKDEGDGKTFHAEHLVLTAPSKDTTADGFGIGTTLDALRAKYGVCLIGGEGDFFLDAPQPADGAPGPGELRYTVTTGAGGVVVGTITLDAPGGVP